MPNLAERLEDFFQERLELLLKVMKLAEVSLDNGRSVWRIKHSRTVLDDTAIYHLSKLAGMKLVEKETQGRSIVAWVISGPTNLPEMIKDQIKKMSIPTTSVAELEDLVLQQGEDIKNLQKDNKSLFDLLDIVIKARNPETTTDPVILQIRGENSIEEIISTVQVARADHVRKAFNNLVEELIIISRRFSGLKDNDLKELIPLLASLLNGEGAKRIGTARRELDDWAKHNGPKAPPPSLDMTVKISEIIIRLIAVPAATNGK